MSFLESAAEKIFLHRLKGGEKHLKSPDVSSTLNIAVLSVENDFLEKDFFRQKSPRRVNRQQVAVQSTVRIIFSAAPSKTDLHNEANASAMCVPIVSKSNSKEDKTHGYGYSLHDAGVAISSATLKFLLPF